MKNDSRVYSAYTTIPNLCVIVCVCVCSDWNEKRGNFRRFWKEKLVGTNSTIN